MANRRSTRSDWDGCYKKLFVEAGYQDEEKGRLVVGEDLPDGVFAVERLVTARKKKRQTVSAGRGKTPLLLYHRSIFSLRSTWFCGKGTVEKMQAG